MAQEEPQVSVRGLLGPGFATLEKQPEFEESNAEFKESNMDFKENHLAPKSQRMQRPYRKLQSADHGVWGPCP